MSDGEVGREEEHGFRKRRWRWRRTGIIKLLHFAAHAALSVSRYAIAKVSRYVVPEFVGTYLLEDQQVVRRCDGSGGGNGSVARSFGVWWHEGNEEKEEEEDNDDDDDDYDDKDDEDDDDDDDDDDNDDEDDATKTSPTPTRTPIKESLYFGTWARPWHLLPVILLLCGALGE
uniref:Uncharacterized protein n=1 Tax=Vespula pensylvanica TaxID=30213 RepID=A0A834UH85_VESPE|nr:hypothetical protein H0235_001369 [Vespula pensylvanica]